MNARMLRNRTLWIRLALAVGIFALLSGEKAECGSEEAGETLRSDVMAVMTVLEQAGGEVEAELVVIHAPDEAATDPSHYAFVTTAQAPTLRLPDGEALPLAQASSGHYVTDSFDEPSLVYEPGGSYRFSFGIEERAIAGEFAGTTFVGRVDAPTFEPSMQVTQAAEVAGDPLSLTYEPAARNAIVRLYDTSTGDLVYQNFDFESPQFTGDKWARLADHGTFTLPAGTIDEPGDYELEVCVVERISDFDLNLSPELGWLSGFLIGRCATPHAFTVAP